MFVLLLLLWSVDRSNNIIACISCGESFRKRGRPQKTAKVYGFSVGCNGGRPCNTTRETGSFVSDGRPRGTNQEAGYAVSDGQPRGTTQEADFSVCDGRPTREAGSNVSGGQPRNTTSPVAAY